MRLDLHQGTDFFFGAGFLLAVLFGFAIGFVLVGNDPLQSESVENGVIGWPTLRKYVQNIGSRHRVLLGPTG